MLPSSGMIVVEGLVVEEEPMTTDDDLLHLPTNEILIMIAKEEVEGQIPYVGYSF